MPLRTHIIAFGLTLAACFLAGCHGHRQKAVDESLPWSARMAESEMIRCPQAWQEDFVEHKKWNYTQALMCKAFLDLYEQSGEERYYHWAKGYADSLIERNGRIYGYKTDNCNLDHLNGGKILYRLFDKTGDDRYMRAIDSLVAQLEKQPRTSEGGFWHKKVYPWQMWLDGLYMAAPFYGEYAMRSGKNELFDDVVNQYILVARHTLDPSNGLYRHAWDEKCEQKWADSLTGQAPHVWGRALGWYSMALVDGLDYIPDDHPGRIEMTTILRNLAVALTKKQDPETGGWYQVMDQGNRAGNYIEASCTPMFAYALLKGVRMGYLDQSFLDPAKKAYNGLLKHFVSVDDQGIVSLTHICGVAGLGGTPYRDGSFEYYINEVIRDNDPKGVAPFIMASLEVERLQ